MNKLFGWYDKLQEPKRFFVMLSCLSPAFIWPSLGILWFLFVIAMRAKYLFLKPKINK